MPVTSEHSDVGIIALKLDNINRLFNSMDPSPFYDKDLDADAEEYIESWAAELRGKKTLKISIRLARLPEEPEPENWVKEALNAYFRNKTVLLSKKLRQLFRLGRYALSIGLVFLALCIALSDLLSGHDLTPALKLAQESLIIVGWVALWRPLEIFLYDWWPLVAERTTYRKLSQADVEILPDDTETTAL